MKPMPRNDFLCKLFGQQPEPGSEIVNLAPEDPDAMSICEEIGLAEEVPVRWRDLPCRPLSMKKRWTN